MQLVRPAPQQAPILLPDLLLRLQQTPLVSSHWRAAPELKLAKHMAKSVACLSTLFFSRLPLQDHTQDVDEVLTNVSQLPDHVLQGALGLLRAPLMLHAVAGRRIVLNRSLGRQYVPFGQHREAL